MCLGNRKTQIANTAAGADSWKIKKVPFPCYQIPSSLVSRQARKDLLRVLFAISLLPFSSPSAFLNLTVPQANRSAFWSLSSDWASVILPCGIYSAVAHLGGIKRIFCPRSPLDLCYFRHSRSLPSMRYIVQFHNDRVLLILGYCLIDALPSQPVLCAIILATLALLSL